MNPLAMLDFLINVARFIILLGVLIFVHELGHFLAAKLTNVYVVRLSLGFGKRLLGFKLGETDYCVSAIPLGGYVKMVGQEDIPRTQEEAEQAEPEVRDVPPERRFDTQPTRTKLLIGFAGPVMNLLFAIPVLWLVYLVGINVPVFSQYAFIGGITPDSPAEEAGIEPGHRVLSINSQPVSGWEDVQLQIMTNQDTQLDFRLQDFTGEVTEVAVTPRRAADATRPTIGIEPLAALAINRIIPDMPAEQSGLLENDVVLTYDGQEPTNENLAKLIETVNKRAGQAISLTILRDDEIFEHTLTPKEVPVIKGIEIQEGIVVFVDKRELDAQAAVDIETGDLVVAVDGRPVQNRNVEELVREKAVAGETVQLTLQKSRLFGNSRQVTVELPVTQRGMIGVVFSPTISRQYAPGVAFLKSFEAYGESLSLTMKTIYYLVSGRVSTREMAGPIGIAVLTTESLKLGVGYYLKLVAFITINLGIINLLPIPMLDGGMIMISIIERIRRRPLEEKYLILLQRIGLVFILFLVLMATYNDIVRAINYFLGHGFIE